MEDTYNGWSNWETWNACLWLENDPYWHDALQHCLSSKDIEELYDFAVESGYITDSISKHRINFTEILESTSLE